MTALKKRGILYLMVAVTVFSVWIPAFASDDNWGYKFSLKTDNWNSYSDGRYRQTTNTANPWKVEMTYHSRGKTAYATYWLARTGDKEQVSSTRDVTCKTGPLKTAAWAGASMVTVSLGAENYANQTADVSGFWEEETF